MSVEVICKRVAGLDVHKKLIVATTLIEDEAGNIEEKHKEFGALPEDLCSLAQWLKSQGIEVVVMESTGVYWKSVYSTLEDADITTQVVNARHAKQVPGRKTDLKDANGLPV